MLDQRPQLQQILSQLCGVGASKEIDDTVRAALAESVLMLVWSPVLYPKNLKVGFYQQLLCLLLLRKLQTLPAATSTLAGGSVMFDACRLKQTRGGQSSGSYKRHRC